MAAALLGRLAPYLIPGAVEGFVKKLWPSDQTQAAMKREVYKGASKVYQDAGGSSGIMSSIGKGIGSLLRDVGEGRTDKEGGIGKSIARSVGQMLGAEPSAEYQAKVRGERALGQYKDYMKAYADVVPAMQRDYMSQMAHQMGLAHLAYGNPVANLPFRQSYAQTYNQPTVTASANPGSTVSGAAPMGIDPADVQRAGYTIKLEKM